MEELKLVWSLLVRIWDKEFEWETTLKEGYYNYYDVYKSKLEDYRIAVYDDGYRDKVALLRGGTVVGQEITEVDAIYEISGWKAYVIKALIESIKEIEAERKILKEKKEVINKFK